jgi:hypothetical protein
LVRISEDASPVPRPKFGQIPRHHACVPGIDLSTRSPASRRSRREGLWDHTRRSHAQPVHRRPSSVARGTVTRADPRPISHPHHRPDRPHRPEGAFRPAFCRAVADGPGQSDGVPRVRPSARARQNHRENASCGRSGRSGRSFLGFIGLGSEVEPGREIRVIRGMVPADRNPQPRP